MTNLEPALVSSRTADLGRAGRRPTAKSVQASRLANTWVFSALSQRELRDVLRHSRTRHVHAGTVLVAEDVGGDDFFVLLAGTARVTRNGRTITELGPGASFGELALLDDGPRTATVETLTDAEVLVVGRRDFARLIDAHPGFARKLLRTLARRLIEADARDFRAS